MTPTSFDEIISTRLNVFASENSLHLHFILKGTYVWVPMSSHSNA